MRTTGADEGRGTDGSSTLPTAPVATRWGVPVGAFDASAHTVHPLSHLWLLWWVLAASAGAVVITPPESTLAIWWPATFVGAGVLLQAPRHRWGLLVVGVAVVVSAGQLLAGRGLGLSCALGATTAAECLVVAWLLGRLGTHTLRRPRDVVALLAAVLAGSVVFAAGLLAAVAPLPSSDYVATVGQVFLSHATAGLCLGPLFLTLPVRRARTSREQVLQWTALVVLELWVFGTQSGAGLALGLLPVLLWGAVRQSPRAAAIQCILLTAVAVLLFSVERGPFTVGPDGPYDDFLAATVALQLFLSSLALTALVVSVVGQQQRLAAEEALAESAFTRTVLATTDAVTVVADAWGRIELVNGAAERATGFSASHLVGRTLWDALVPQERSDHVRAAFLLADRPEDVELEEEEEIRTAQGRVLRLRMSTSVLSRGEGRPASLVLTGIDVTDERRTSDLLRRMLRASSGTAVIGVEVDGTMSFISRGAEELLGLGARSAIGRGFTELVAHAACDVDVTVDPAADPGEEVRRVSERLGGPEDRAAHDWWWRRADGELVTVSQTLDEVLDGSGRPTGYLALARDVTEQRRSQQVLLTALRRERQAVEQLRSLDQAKREFVTTVSHELRTPVSSIVGYAEVFRDSVDDPALTPLVQAIARNGYRLRDLADDLATLADLESRTSTEGGTVDLRVELTSVVELHTGGTAGDSRRVRLRDHLDDGAAAVHGDPAHLRRAFAAVVDNACKFSPHDSPVEVILEGHEDALTVRVRDEGTGIPADEVANVLGRFFRGRNAHDHAVQGPGLGLALTDTIMRLHGGRVLVSSTEGAGTEVELRLPRQLPRSG